MTSVALRRVSSDMVHSAIVNYLKTNELPFKNVMSILMDSCSVMRGVQNGVERKLRTEIPHLLDIGGESVHHAHNAGKAFSLPFENHLEGMFGAIATDFKYCTDYRESLEEMCEILGIKYTVPER